MPRVQDYKTVRRASNSWLREESPNKRSRTINALDRKASGKPPKLTDKQIRLAQFLVAGYLPRYIAAILGIKVNAVNGATQRLYEKLGVENKQGLITYLAKNPSILHTSMKEENIVHDDYDPRD